ncbi:MAG: DUF115 domain-containing protein [Spirochaetales bacterium]|nr:DUF115 domain-containing protein [Spirochaetales bacterium]
MTDFLKQNREIIQKRFPRLLPFLDKKSPSAPLSIKQSRSGLPVPCLKEKDRDYPLHSLFDPVKEGEKLLRNYSREGVKVFIGLGGAYQILPFLEGSTILIIEPDPAVLTKLLTLMDYSKILVSPRVYLFCGNDNREISQWLGSHYIPLLDGNLDVLPLRSYRQEGLIKQIQREIQEGINEISADCSTQKKFGKQWQRNIINNCDRALAAPFSPDNFNHYDKAMIAAAGPGLEKHLTLMAERPARTFLLSVDTALPTLLAQGIVPDGIITIDPQPVSYLHFMRRLPPSCLIIADWGSPLPQKIKERALFTTSGHPLCHHLLHEGKGSLMQLDSGGNVSQAALSLLGRGNFKEITLLGADFSYPEGKPYCRESYFYSWYSQRVSRLGTLENHMTQFVLARAERDINEKESVYNSPLMKAYKKNLEVFLNNKGWAHHQKKDGLWRILPNAEPGPAKTIKQGDPTILPSYRKELKMMVDKGNHSSSPISSTLLPLAYHFLEDDKSKALKKAAQYTLDLLN